MPLLRKKPSNIKYNENKIVIKVENTPPESNSTQDINKPHTSSDSPVPPPSSDCGSSEKSVNLSSAVNSRHVPEEVFSNDGRKFFPCQFCCRAFAFKKRQVAHTEVCSFRRNKENCNEDKNNAECISKATLENDESQDDGDDEIMFDINFYAQNRQSNEVVVLTPNKKDDVNSNNISAVQLIINDFEEDWINSDESELVEVRNENVASTVDDDINAVSVSKNKIIESAMAENNSKEDNIEKEVVEDVKKVKKTRSKNSELSSYFFNSIQLRNSKKKIVNNVKSKVQKSGKRYKKIKLRKYIGIGKKHVDLQKIKKLNARSKKPSKISSSKLNHTNALRSNNIKMKTRNNKQKSSPTIQKVTKSLDTLSICIKKGKKCKEELDENATNMSLEELPEKNVSNENSKTPTTTVKKQVKVFSGKHATRAFTRSMKKPTNVTARYPIVIKTVKKNNRLPKEVMDKLFNCLKENKETTEALGVKSRVLRSSLKSNDIKSFDGPSSSLSNNSEILTENSSSKIRLNDQSPEFLVAQMFAAVDEPEVPEVNTKCGILQKHKQEMKQIEKTKQDQPVNESVYDFDEEEEDKDLDLQSSSKKRKLRKRLIKSTGPSRRKRQIFMTENFPKVAPNLKELEADIGEVSNASITANFPLLVFTSEMQHKVCPFPYCNELLGSEDSFIEHKILKHQIGKILLKADKLPKYDLLFLNSDKKKCPICFKQITATMNWKRHLNTHCQEREFVCKICKKKFSRADHVKNHEQRHLDSVKIAYGVMSSDKSKE